MQHACLEVAEFLLGALSDGVSIEQLAPYLYERHQVDAKPQASFLQEVCLVGFWTTGPDVL